MAAFGRRGGAPTPRPGTRPNAVGANDIYIDRIDEVVLALLHLELRDAGRMEVVRLGCDEPASRKGLHFRSGWHGEVGSVHRGRGTTV